MQNSQHSHRVGGGDERAEQRTLERRELLDDAGHHQAVQRAADERGADDGADEGEQRGRQRVGEEALAAHGEAALEDDGRQQHDEEHVPVAVHELERAHRRVGEAHEAAHDGAEHDGDLRLADPVDFAQRHHVAENEHEQQHGDHGEHDERHGVHAEVGLDKQRAVAAGRRIGRRRRRRRRGARGGRHASVIGCEVCTGAPGFAQAGL
mmetsp:Transcript_53867/g.132049  ORF Transcript_53867/g.132049 Transcript_53867/m.132049 type:complete len:208 (-) Transcript_53867:39-662(-)